MLGMYERTLGLGDLHYHYATDVEKWSAAGNWAKFLNLNWEYWIYCVYERDYFVAQQSRAPYSTRWKVIAAIEAVAND